MSTTWFAKLDCNLHSNRKVLRAGRLGREVWIFILCLNAQRGAHGEFPEAELEPWYVAHQLGIPEAEARAGIQACIDAELIAIEDGAVILCGWNDEYGRGPNGSTERVRKHRAKKSAEKDETRPDARPQSVIETTKEDPCNACNVTGNDGNVSRNDDVTLKRRKEGEKGEGGKRAHAETPEPEQAAPEPSGKVSVRELALSTWKRVSELRVAIAAELKLKGVHPFPVITPAEPRGFRDLRERLHEEGVNAPAVVETVLEVLERQARKERSVDWLAEKTFGEGGWRHAKDSAPKWLSKPALRVVHDDEPDLSNSLLALIEGGAA